MGMAHKARRAVKLAIVRNRAKPKLRIIQTPRRDKIRPKAAKHLSKWNCRPNGRNRHERSPEKNTSDPRSIKQNAAIRERLSELQDGRCALCGHVVTEIGSIDHTDPLYFNGYDGWGNWTFAHRDCNIAKANDEPTGCEIIWLFAVNARLGEGPTRW